MEKLNISQFVNLTTEELHEFSYLNESSLICLDCLKGRLIEEVNKSIPDRINDFRIIKDMSVKDYGDGKLLVFTSHINISDGVQNKKFSISLYYGEIKGYYFNDILNSLNYQVGLTIIEITRSVIELTKNQINDCGG